MAQADLLDDAAHISAFDCDVIRNAFRAWVLEDNIPEDRWRASAAQMIRDFTGLPDVSPELLDWIVRR